MSFGDLELHGRSDIFSLALIKVVQGRVQLPITDSTRPWDNFMVHGVNNPSEAQIQSRRTNLRLNKNHKYLEVMFLLGPYYVNHSGDPTRRGGRLAMTFKVDLNTKVDGS